MMESALSLRSSSRLRRERRPSSIVPMAARRAVGGNAGELAHDPHLARRLVRRPPSQLQQRGTRLVLRVIARGGQCPHGSFRSLARQHWGAAPSQHEARVIPRAPPLISNGGVRCGPNPGSASLRVDDRTMRPTLKPRPSGLAAVVDGLAGELECPARGRPGPQRGVDHGLRPAGLEDHAEDEHDEHRGADGRGCSHGHARNCR